MPADIYEMHRKAKTDSCVAQTFLGLNYLYGDDIEVNYEEAFKLLSAAAKQGGSRATIGLASMYAKGLGIPGDVNEAIRLLESVAAPANGPDASAARIQLARLYSQGLGIRVDIEKAIRWYESALAIATGKEDPRDLQEAKTYLGQAGRQQIQHHANEY
jgi:TPR repeat protein